MLIGLIISFLLCVSKIFSISYFYNLLFVPFLGYLFLSKESIYFISKKISFFSLIFLLFFFFFNFILSDIKESILFLLLRSISISTFVLSIFGLLPFNRNIIKFFIWPVIFSIPAIFFIFQPPVIYRFSASNEFISTPGLFNSFSLAGLFPTSAYFAITLLSILLYYSFYKEKIKEYIFFIKSKKFNIFASLILILFTNRKAYFFGLIFSPINNFFILLKNIIIERKIYSKSISYLISLLIVLLILFLLLFNGVGDGGYGFNAIFNQIMRRLHLYYEIAVEPEMYTFNETAMQKINFLGGYISFYAMYVFLAFSLLLSVLNLSFPKISIFLISYFYIFQFLFKEPQTILSPSPSSLFLFMMISYLINILQKHNTFKKTNQNGILK